MSKERGRGKAESVACGDYRRGPNVVNTPALVVCYCATLDSTSKWRQQPLESFKSPHSRESTQIGRNLPGDEQGGA